MEMLRDRGCNVSDSDLNLSLTEFLSEFGPNPDHERLSVCVLLRSKPSKKLPLMLATDATARYYGLEKGQVVNVTYSGGLAGPLETYRCVAWFFYKIYMPLYAVMSAELQKRLHILDRVSTEIQRGVGLLVRF